MARTKRTARRGGYKKIPEGKLKRGLAQYSSTGCSHHNSCNWCSGGRTHTNRRRAPIEEKV